MDPGKLFGLIAPYAAGDGPGHAVGVYRGGALVAHAAAGCAVIEHDIPRPPRPPAFGPHRRVPVGACLRDRLHGSWLGSGTTAAIRLRLAGDELWCEEIVGDEPPGVYVRVGEPPAAAPPAGTYHSQELQAYATLAAGDGGTATVTIGLGGPRALSPASGNVWAGDGLTVRLLDGGAGLEISLYGARRCQFARTGSPPPARQRGL